MCARNFYILGKTLKHLYSVLLHQVLPEGISHEIWKRRLGSRLQYQVLVTTFLHARNSYMLGKTLETPYDFVLLP